MFHYHFFYNIHHSKKPNLPILFAFYLVLMSFQLIDCAKCKHSMFQGTDCEWCSDNKVTVPKTPIITKKEYSSDDLDLDLASALKASVITKKQDCDDELDLVLALSLSLQISPKIQRFYEFKEEKLVVDGCEVKITGRYHNCVVINYTSIIACYDGFGQLGDISLEKIFGCTTKCMLIALYDVNPEFWQDKYQIKSPLDLYTHLRKHMHINEGTMLEYYHLQLCEKIFKIKIGVLTKTENGKQYGDNPTGDLTLTLLGNHYLNGSQLIQFI